MAHTRIDRKGFLKSLGLAATAFAARPAAAATARFGMGAERTNAAAELPMKARPQTRIIARRDVGA